VRACHNGPAASAIAASGAIIVAREATDLVVTFLFIVCDRAEDVDRFRTAGTIFVGPWSVQASGDYCTGSNHVLPTGGTARFRGGLNAGDFVRVFSVQTLTPQGLAAIGPSAITLARAEGLTAHADSIAVRLSEGIRATRIR
jgi:histidinol dehydrogenase